MSQGARQERLENLRRALPYAPVVGVTAAVHVR